LFLLPSGFAAAVNHHRASPTNVEVKNRGHPEAVDRKAPPRPRVTTVHSMREGHNDQEDAADAEGRHDQEGKMLRLPTVRASCILLKGARRSGRATSGTGGTSDPGDSSGELARSRGWGRMASALRRKPRTARLKP
jgi:hypothetical protein